MLTPRLQNILWPVFLMLIHSLYGQGDLTSGGGFATGNGGSISYSLGQVAVELVESPSLSIQEGIQQIYPIPEILNTEIIEERPYSIYPNPTSDFILIDGELLPELYLIIHDLQGKIVLRRKLGSPKISLESLASGTYTISLLNANQTIQTQTILKIN